MNKNLNKMLIFLLICALFTITFNQSFTRTVSAQDEYDILREKWKETLTGGSTYDTSDPDIAAKVASITSKAQSRWNSMAKTPDKYLWSDLASTTSSSHIKESYQRLLDMALAYCTRGSSLKDNPNLLADIITGLEWLNNNRYSTNSPKPGYGNAWDWWCGVPYSLTDITILLYDHLTPTQRNNYMNAITRYLYSVGATGANRMSQIRIVAARGIIQKNGGNTNGIGNARNGFSELLDYVEPDAEEKDGFYRDGTFIQHDYHVYNTGYGNMLVTDMARVLYVLHGSSWEVTDPDIKNIEHWIREGFEPVVYKGAAMDAFTGRGIAQYQTPDHYNGHLFINALAQIAQYADPSQAYLYKSIVKDWVQTDTTSPGYYSYAPLYYTVLVKDIMADSSIEPRGELLLNHQYPNGARAVHRAHGFAYTISMASTTIKRYECLSEENLKGWYLSAGMTYLYNDDLTQFSDNLWPTVNWYRLPGTTVDTIVRSNNSGTNASSQNLVGGTSIGLYGVTGMVLDAYSTNLKANKAWFMFDDEVVALGNGITCSGQTGNGWDGAPRRVETIVENRKLNSSGNNAFKVNGVDKPAAIGWNEALTGVTTAHLAGNVSGADIGYYFPEGATLKGLREKRSGRWSDINNTYYTNTLHTNNFLTLWFDHGTNPTNASYAYAVLPNKTSEQVESYASDPDFIILENSPDVQAVKEKRLNAVGAFFRKDAQKWVNDDGIWYLQSLNKAAIMTMESDNELEVAVSDPTRENKDTIQIEINRSATGVLSIDEGVEVTQLSPTIKMSIRVNASEGKAFKAKFNLDGNPPVTTTPAPAPTATPIPTPSPTPTPPQQMTIKVEPTDDTYVSTNEPDANYGAHTLLYSGINPDGAVREIYVKFDIRNIKDRIISAKFKGVFLNWKNSNVHVYPVTDKTWSEKTMTYSNRASYDNSNPIAVKTGVPAKGVFEWDEYDITSYIQSVQSENGIPSIVIKHMQATGSTVDKYRLQSKEHPDASVRPYLEIVIDRGCVTSSAPVFKKDNVDITETGLEAGLISAEVYIENTTRYPKDVKLVMALYNGNKLENITMSDTVTVDANTEDVPLSTMMNITGVTEEHLLKVFVWDDLASIIPVNESTRFTVK